MLHKPKLRVTHRIFDGTYAALESSGDRYFNRSHA
jgi:hypothetical protein